MKTVDNENQKRDEALEELEESRIAHQQQINDLKHSFSTMGDKLGEVRGLLVEVKESAEKGRDKQADFYREELKKLEVNFRQELSKNSGADAIMMVRKLEKDLLLLPEGVKAKRAPARGRAK